MNEKINYNKYQYIVFTIENRNNNYKEYSKIIGKLPENIKIKNKIIDTLIQYIGKTFWSLEDKLLEGLDIHQDIINTFEGDEYFIKELELFPLKDSLIIKHEITFNMTKEN